MKKLVWICGASMLVMLLAPGSLPAEQILHHDLKVDADSTARGCLECHDGASAKHVSFCKVSCDFSGGHSLLKRYPPKGKEAEFAPSSVVEAKGIKLENGNVTCNSCHDLRNASRGHLIMEDTQSRLCRTCHVRM